METRVEGRWKVRLAQLSRAELRGYAYRVQAYFLGKRFPANIARCPHEELLERLAAAIVKRSNYNAYKRMADEVLAKYCPVPEWAVDSVLTNPDLVPCLLDSLPIRSNYAAVCSAWRNGWRQALRNRKVLKPVLCKQPDFDMTPEFFVSMRPVGEHLMTETCHDVDISVRLLNKSMRTEIDVSELGTMLHVCPER